MQKYWLIGLVVLMPLSASAAQRVVSTGVCADQWLLALADPQQIAGVSRMASRSDISAYATEARGHEVHNGSAEQIIRLEPDLVIADAYTRRATIAALERLHIPVLRLPKADTLDAWRTLMSQFMDAFGTTEAYQKTATGMDRDWAALSRLSGQKRGLSVVYRPGGYSPGKGTLPENVLAVAGFTNLASVLGMNYTKVLPLELLVYHQPPTLVRDVPYLNRTSLSGLMLEHRAYAGYAHSAVAYDYPMQNWFCLSPRTLSSLKDFAQALGRYDGADF